MLESRIMFLVLGLAGLYILFSERGREFLKVITGLNSMY